MADEKRPYEKPAFTKVPINASPTMPPVEGEEVKGVLMETEPFRPHTGDYAIIDLLSQVRADIETAKEEDVSHSGLTTKPDADQVEESVNAALDALTTLEASSLFAVLVERARQNDKWGGPAHDDQHTIDEWAGFIMGRARVLELVGMTCDDDGVYHGEADLEDGMRLQIDATPGHVRKLLVEIAALALAALEAHDRRNG